MNKGRPKGIVRFGEFELDLGAGALHRAGVRVAISEQPLRLLEVLVSEPGVVVTRDELRSRLWSEDTFVDFEHGLNAAVKRLRDTLAESADQPRFIETVPKRGYRFIAPVVAPPPTDTSSPRVRRRRQTVALILGVLAVSIAIASAVIATRSARRSIEGPPSALTLRRITGEAGLQIQPSWSPDGEFVAYASDRNGNMDIFVQPVSGGAARQITQDPADDVAPAWSPNGDLLAFRSDRRGGGIYVVNVRGGDERLLAPFGQRPRWSPEGKRLLITSQTGRGDWTDKHAFLLTLDGRAPTEILAEFFKGVIKSPSVAWHPDGERISIWGEHRSLGKGFWTARLPDGAPELSPGSVEPITKAYWFWWFMDFIWAPGGDALYFTGPGADSTGVMNVWRVPVDPVSLQWTRQPERLSVGPGADFMAAVSRDGRRLAYANQRTVKRLMSFDLGGNGLIADREAAKPLTDPGVEVICFDISRDGSKLVLLQEPSGKEPRPPAIAERDIATGREYVLSDMVGPWTDLPQFPRWSPNGHLVTYVRRGNRNAEGQLTVHHPELVVLDARTRHERIVPAASGHVIITAWDFSSQGDWIAVDDRPQAALDTGPAQVTLYSLSGASVRSIGSPPGLSAWQARFSPDGRWIAVAASADPNKSAALYVVRESGGTFTQLTDGTAYDSNPRWSSDGAFLYFLSSRGSPDRTVNIWALRFHSRTGKAVGPPFQVTNYTGRSRSLPFPEFADFRIANDRLIVPIVETSGNIWMLEKPR
jgi:Tol biopolymer transport system component/DNA-binding winged helix-turn-helix (wHTH) protein